MSDGAQISRVEVGNAEAAGIANPELFSIGLLGEPGMARIQSVQKFGVVGIDDQKFHETLTVRVPFNQRRLQACSGKPTTVLPTVSNSNPTPWDRVFRHLSPGSEHSQT